MTTRIKKVFVTGLFFMMLISSCYSAHNNRVTNQFPSTTMPNTPSPLIKTASPPLSASNTPFITFTPPDVQSRKLMKDYLLFINKTEKNNKWGIFSILPGERSGTLLTESINGLNFKGLSPQNQFMLFDGGAVYLSNNDCSDYHQIFYDKQYQIINAFWISNNQIIINAFKKPGHVPDLFILQIDGSHIQVVSQNSSKIVLTSFPTLGIAIEKDFTTHKFFIIDNNGNEQKFLEGFHDIEDFIGLSKQSNEYIFIGIKNGEDVKRLWALTVDYLNLREIYNLKDYEIQQAHLSPDNKYLAFTAFSSICGNKACINFIDIKTGKLDFQWEYPYWPNDQTFIWSPDSEFIALPFTNGGPSDVGTIFYGIQVMDVSTGKTVVILKDNIISLSAWIRVEN